MKRNPFVPEGFTLEEFAAALNSCSEREFTGGLIFRDRDADTTKDTDLDYGSVVRPFKK